MADPIGVQRVNSRSSNNRDRQALLRCRGIDVLQFLDSVVRIQDARHERWELTYTYRQLSPQTTHTDDTLALLPIGELRAMVSLQKAAVRHRRTD